MEPVTIICDKKNSIESLKEIVLQHSEKGYDFVLINFSNGDAFAMTLNRFQEMQFSGVIKQLTFKQRQGK